MDPDEPSLETADLAAGGDNLLSSLTTAMTSHPEASSKSIQDDDDDDGDVFADDGDGDDDTFETVNINNSNATAEVAGKEEFLGEDPVEMDPLDIVGLEAERLDGAVEDLGPLSGEKLETEEEKATSEGPFMDDSELVEDVEEIGRISQEGALEGSRSEEHEDDQKNEDMEEDANEERKDEDKEQDQIPDEDDTKESSAPIPAQEDSTESPQNLKRLQRVALYKKGLKLQEEPANIDEALHSYLAAITGLTESEAFTELPSVFIRFPISTLRRMNVEKAVHFIQAEKMYYETALIDIVNLKKELEVKRQEKGDDVTEDLERLAQEGPDTPEIIKAKEYENLAKLCLEESKPQLALEYCGKATKAYREIYGDDHPITVRSLDLFTMIYADVGKKLYADAMQKFGVEEKDLEASAVSQSQSSSQVTTAGGETTNELRQRSNYETQQPTSQSSAESASPPGTEFEPAPPLAVHDDWVTTCLLMLLFFLITILVLLVMSYFYCVNNERSSICHDLKGDLSYWYMKIKHYYLGFGRR